MTQPAPHPQAHPRAHPRAYAALRGFIAPALGTPGLRPVIFGFIIVETLYQLGQKGFGTALEALAPDFALSVQFGDTPAGMLVGLGSFVILILALALVLRQVHGRGLASLVGGPPARVAAQFVRVFLPIALLFVISELIQPWWTDDAVAEYRSLGLWLALLPLSLFTLLVQTGSEELFYRGYLQQQIAAWNLHPLAWLVLPNLAFAVAHLSADVSLFANLQYFIWAFFFGLAASDLTARAGTLGPSLAYHMANNAYAFLFFAPYEGVDSGLALVLFNSDEVTLPFSDGPDLVQSLAPLGTELVLVALMWGAARLALRR